MPTISDDFVPSDSFMASSGDVATVLDSVLDQIETKATRQKTKSEYDPIAIAYDNQRLARERKTRPSTDAYHNAGIAHSSQPIRDTVDRREFRNTARRAKRNQARRDKDLAIAQMLADQARLNRARNARARLTK